MSDPREDSTDEGQDPSKPPDPMKEAKHLAMSLGSSLVGSLKEQARRNAERDREWRSRRKLTGSEWLLCFLVPPWGMWKIWKDRQNIRPHYAIYASVGGSLTMLVEVFVGVLLLLMVGNLVSDARQDMRRKSEQRSAEATNERLLPEYERQLAEAVRLYNEGRYAEADRAFFELTGYAGKVKEENYGLFYTKNWDNKQATAILGRAAIAIEQGHTEEGYALVRQALDVTTSSTDGVMPVSSLKTDAYLTQQRKAIQEEAGEWLARQEEKERLQAMEKKAELDRQRIVEEIKQHNSTSAPRSTSATTKKDGYTAGYQHGYRYGTTIVNNRSSQHVVPALLDQEWSIAEIGLSKWANDNDYDVTRTYRNAFEKGFRDAQAGRGPAH